MSVLVLDMTDNELNKEGGEEGIRVTCRRGVERDFGRGKRRSER